jgi:hypothetical protein
MNKEQGKRAITIVANEQRIKKKSFLFKEQKHHQLQVRMNKGKKRGALIVIANNE